MNVRFGSARRFGEVDLVLVVGFSMFRIGIVYGYLNLFVIILKFVLNFNSVLRL